MRFLKTYFFFFFVLLYTTIAAQTLGDFRSFQDGNWNDPASWEYFDGSTWVSPPTNTNYPGDGIVTNDVAIISDHTITLNINVNSSSLNSLTIGDQSGTATSISTLIVGVGGNNTYELDTNQISILYDGLMQWGGNNTLELLSGTSISVEQNSPYNPTTVLGTDYGLYEVGGCSTPMEIIIGGVLYSNCNGGGSPPKPPTFEDVNDGGGNLSVSPTFTGNRCTNQTLNLFANPGGTELGDTPINYTWNVTPPSGSNYTLPNTENPTDTPTILGFYNYEVTITNASGVSNTNDVSVEIISCNKTVITNRRITYRVKK